MRTLFLIIAIMLPALAAAQFRAIPADAKRGAIRHIQQMNVEINGKAMRLAPGAQIRNAGNLIVMPTALPADAIVKYQVDAQGLVNRVWILSPQEIAQPDPKQ